MSKIEEIQSKIGCKGKTVIMPYNIWMDTLYNVNEYLWEQAIDAVNEHVASEHGMDLSSDGECYTGDKNIEIYLSKHTDECICGLDGGLDSIPHSCKKYDPK